MALKAYSHSGSCTEEETHVVILNPGWEAHTLIPFWYHCKLHCFKQIHQTVVGKSLQTQYKNAAEKIWMVAAETIQLLVLKTQSYRLSTASFRSCPALYKGTPYVPVLFFFPAEVTPTFASLHRCSEIDFSFMLNGCDASGTCTLRSRAPPELTFGHSTHSSKWILATFYFVERIITWLLWKYRTPEEY